MGGGTVASGGRPQVARRGGHGGPPLQSDFVFLVAEWSFKEADRFLYH